ncbi:hypothetical protein IHE55_04785 [Streptomyces pactum]|uniref:Uncharacterized protein n=1 Tax=Streptomyces pactum TaxID=68249 RepID=A0ABS0NG46_9ACTN|nr:hypothetical protein [Streptomyces pactum]MBH5334154.1 hypothetical protein [Streptomyces pactum]
MRPAQDPAPEYPRRSSTPIYDALYAEYRRLFRALPGDRTGDEELGFVGFAALGPDGRRQPNWQRQTPGTGRTAADRPADRPYRGGFQPALPPAPRDGHGIGY